MSTEEFQTKVLKELADLKEKVDLLNMAVLGNKNAGIDGLVKQVHDHDQYIEKDKSWKAKIAGGLAVAAICAPLLWELVKHWAGI